MVSEPEERAPMIIERHEDVTPAALEVMARTADPGNGAPGTGTPWWTLDMTLTLEPGAAALPRPPIK